jgi:hypothetical protein
MIDLNSDTIYTIPLRNTWLSRWGIVSLFVTLIILITSSLFISYPDTLIAKALITGQTPPVEIYPKINTKVAKILVENNSYVNKLQLLAVLDELTNYNDVLKLDTVIEQIEKNRFKIDSSVFNINSNNLGEISFSLYNLKQIVVKYNEFLKHNSIDSGVHFLRKSEISNRLLKQKFYHELSMSENQYNTDYSGFLRDKKLYESGAISLAEFEKSKNNIITSEKNVLAVEKKIIQTEIDNNNLLINIYDLNNNKYLYLNKLESEYKAICITLGREIDDWKEKNLILSPISGYLSYLYASSDYSDVNVDKAMFVIVQKQNNIKGKCYVPLENSGQLKESQEVIIRLDNYPSQEFGVLKGITKNVSFVPVNGYYIVDIEINQNQDLLQKEAINYKENISGQATIIVREKTLFKRIIGI